MHMLHLNVFSLQQLCFGSWLASNQGVFCVFSGCFCAAWWVFISLNLCFLMPPVIKASCHSVPALPDAETLNVSSLIRAGVKKLLLIFIAVFICRMYTNTFNWGIIWNNIHPHTSCFFLSRESLIDDDESWYTGGRNVTDLSITWWYVIESTNRTAWHPRRWSQERWCWHQGTSWQHRYSTCWRRGKRVSPWSRRWRERPEWGYRSGIWTEEKTGMKWKDV